MKLRHGGWDLFLLCSVSALALSVGCTGKRGAKGPAGDADSTTFDREISQGQDLPGLNVEILELRGARSKDGSFRPGDKFEVDFKVTLDDDTPVPLDQIDFLGAMVSGPTFHYQRVFPEVFDVIANAVEIGDGMYRYTFAGGLPATYAAPLNDSDDLTVGEWTGEDLVAGTYTIGIEMYRSILVDESSIRDVASATLDFSVLGGDGGQARQVVDTANCNQCHGELRAHGTIRRDTAMCVLCHTAGAEDRISTAAGGTPGVTIDFKVMIHKIHSGHSLPSVQGLSTADTGFREYDPDGSLYQIVGFGENVHDFSEVVWPAWPSLAAPMPRDTGYSGLSTDNKAKEDAVRSGPTGCVLCHGDPDGDGPITAPAQGALAFDQPSRAACGSCHDDVDFTKPYRSNAQKMPAQNDDSSCLLCHSQSDGALYAGAAHLHPMLNPDYNGGVNVVVSDLLDVGTGADGDGHFDVGEKISFHLSILDDEGNVIAPGDLSRIEAILSGPSENPQIMNLIRIPTGRLSGNAETLMRLPDFLLYEYVGTSTGSSNEDFATARKPHWQSYGAATTVYAHSATGATSALNDGVEVGDNYFDVTPGDGVLFARNDVLVIDAGTPSLTEYLLVQYVEDDRLWLSSIYTSTYTIGFRFAHSAGAVIGVATLDTLTEGVDYTLNESGGVISEIGDFGAGVPVVVTYTSDYVVPAVFPGALNGSPDLTAKDGDWSGLPTASGVYHLGIQAARSFSVVVETETTSYTAASPADPVDLEFLDDADLDVPARLDTANCMSCHVDIAFHGGSRRGPDTCLLCHGTAGAEDRAVYVAPGETDPTVGLTISFRTMLHKIHHGSELAAGADYVVNGFGSGYPNNYTAHTYEEVEFPRFDGGTSACAACHGADNEAWKVPAGRDHPLGQDVSTQVWRVVCSSCHDSSEVSAHIGAMTGPDGGESCALCHGEDGEYAVERMHRRY